MTQDKFLGFQFKSMMNFFKYFYFLFAFIPLLFFSAGSAGAKETNYGFTTTPTPLQSTDTSFDLNISRIENGHKYVLLRDVSGPDDYNGGPIARFITGLNATTTGGTWSTLQNRGEVLLNANSPNVVIKNLCETYTSNPNPSNCQTTFGAGTRHFMLIDVTNVCVGRDPTDPCAQKGVGMPTSDDLKGDVPYGIGTLDFKSTVNRDQGYSILLFQYPHDRCPNDPNDDGSNNYDLANCNMAMSIYNVVRDSTWTILVYKPNQDNPTVNITSTANNANKHYNGDVGQINEDPWEDNPLDAGTYYLTVQRKDKDGNQATILNNFRFVVDPEVQQRKTLIDQKNLTEGPANTHINVPCQATDCDTAIGKISTNPSTFITDVFKIALGIAGGVAFLLMIFGAFRLLTSGGNPDSLNAGRDLITSAVVGLLFITFSVLLLRIIGVDILHIPGFSGS